MDNIYESKLIIKTNQMKLKIYSNQSNEILLKKTITNEILKQYDINVNSDEFTELFEQEILNDIMNENNINSSNVYYELI
tara:strand:+ start:262 stop:501 length:240 start_codon:yes stop_codon:yes gene_type:complete